MNDREIEQRELANIRSRGICAVCGKPLTDNQPQYAHKIPNKEMYRKKYGSYIIDHTLNGEMVCCLGCNQSVDVGSSYGNHLEVIANIVVYEMVKMWGKNGVDKMADLLLTKYKEMGYGGNNAG